MNKNIILCRDLCKSFNEENNIIPVLKKINLNINHGECVAIVGSSGTGKSTLLQLLGGLDFPTSGKVIINNLDVSLLNNKNTRLLRNKYLGFVYQFHHLLPEFSALENVMMPLKIAKINKKDAINQALTMLEKVGLSDRTQHRPAQMSGGEKQRTAVARSLIMKPACILADEPTGNLDELTAQNIIELMISINKQQNSCLVIVTHDKKIANQMDKVYQLKESKLFLIN